MKTLSKGERLKLADHVNVNEDFVVNVIVNGSDKFEICCYGIDCNGNIVDGFFIFEGKTKSPFGAVVLAFDKKGQFKRGQFNVKLSVIPETVERLIFVVSAGNSSVKSIPAGDVFIGKNKPVLRCQFTGTVLPNTPAASIIEIYRKDNVWRLQFAADSLRKEHSNFVQEKLRKPPAIVPPPVIKLAVQSPVVPPPIPKSSTPAENTANLPQWVKTLANGDDSIDLWFLPNIEKQVVSAKCREALSKLTERHSLWTLWFWIPFGAVLGWIHLALRSFRKRYLAYAALYSVVLLVPYSNGFWQVNVLAWIVGLIHCYWMSHGIFRYMIESTDGRHYEPNKIVDDKYNLNTIDFKTFESNAWQNALPVLIDRHNRGQFRDMPTFFKRLEPWINRPDWKDEFSKNCDAVVVSNRTKFLHYIIAPLLLFCVIGGVWGVYTISPPEVKETLVPQIQQQVYSFFGWDFYKIVHGSGSGVNRNEALRQAKADALGNALGEQLTRKETGKSGMITVSDDEGDKNKAEQESQEDYEKQVEGKISDVEIISESQSDGLFHVTIKAKVLMTKKEPTK